MRTNPPDAALDGPFRAPERLALALPMFSVVGLMLVVSAAATGQSTLVVALASVVGFAICALAPMALLELYVGRPLRALLAHLRAARDGLEAPGVAPSGVIGDLVAAARDIRADQASAERLTAALTHCETLAAAGDETMRAFRQNFEAKPKDDGATQWAEVSEALKALKPAPVDGATERIEQMLVYLAETVERRDADDKRADLGLERVEQALTDIVRLIGRETQALRDCVSTAALTVRNDVAATVADDQAVESRRAERLETLEARLIGKIDAASRVRPAPDPLGEIFLNEAAALAERWREQTQAQATRLDQIEGNVARRIAESPEAEAKTVASLTRTAEKLRNAIDRLDALSASASTVVAMQNDDLSAALRALEGEVAGLGGRFAGVIEASGQAQTQAILARIDAGASAWETQASALTLAASVDAQTLAALRSDIGTVKARIAEIAPRAAAAAETLASRVVARLDALDTSGLQAAAHDLAQSAAEHARQWEAALQSYDARMVERAHADVVAPVVLDHASAVVPQAEAHGGPLAEALSDLRRRLAASH